MTKAEFRKHFTAHREKALREMYKNDPHGPACLAVSLVDIPKQVDRLWHKFRGTLREVTVAEYEKLTSREKPDDNDAEGNAKV